MNSRLPFAQIEAILRDHLQPYHCECRPGMDQSLSVRLYREPDGGSDDGDELTVLGIDPAQCQAPEDLARLARELRIELDATRGSVSGRTAGGGDEAVMLPAS